MLVSWSQTQRRRNISRFRCHCTTQPSAPAAPPGKDGGDVAFRILLEPPASVRRLQRPRYRDTVTESASLSLSTARRLLPSLDGIRREVFQPARHFSFQHLIPAWLSSGLPKRRCAAATASTRHLVCRIATPRSGGESRRVHWRWMAISSPAHAGSTRLAVRGSLRQAPWTPNDAAIIRRWSQG